MTHGNNLPGHSPSSPNSSQLSWGCAYRHQPLNPKGHLLLSHHLWGGHPSSLPAWLLYPGSWHPPKIMKIVATKLSGPNRKKRFDSSLQALPLGNYTWLFWQHLTLQEKFNYYYISWKRNLNSAKTLSRNKRKQPPHLREGEKNKRKKMLFKRPQKFPSTFESSEHYIYGLFLWCFINFGIGILALGRS